MQASQLARLKAESARGRFKPPFPAIANFMMSHVWRVTDKERIARTSGQIDLAVVGELKMQTARITQNARICARHQKSQRVNVDANEAGIGEGFCRR